MREELFVPARLSGSSASASSPSAAFWDGAAEGCLVSRQLLLLLEHPKGGDPRAGGLLCLPQPSSSGLCRAIAEMGLQGSQTPLETPRINIHVPRFGGFSSGRSPGANPSLRVPAEGTSPAPARVTKAGGIVPGQSRLSIPGVGAGGHPALG